MSQDSKAVFDWLSRYIQHQVHVKSDAVLFAVTSTPVSIGKTRIDFGTTLRMEFLWCSRCGKRPVGTQAAVDAIRRLLEDDPEAPVDRLPEVLCSSCEATIRCVDCNGNEPAVIINGTPICYCGKDMTDLTAAER